MLPTDISVVNYGQVLCGYLNTQSRPEFPDSINGWGRPLFCGLLTRPIKTAIFCTISKSVSNQFQQAQLLPQPQNQINSETNYPEKRNCHLTSG